MGKSTWMGTQGLALLLVSTKSLVRQSQHQFNEGALSTMSENRPLMGSTARECRMQALVGNGSPAAITP